MDTEIQHAKSRIIFDSRGNPTIESEIYTKKSFGRASAPSGLSTSTYEVPHMPSGGPKKALEILNSYILPKLRGLDSSNQQLFDSTLRELDGTQNFSKIGGAASTSLSFANAKAAANTLELPLYRHLNNYGDYKLPLPLGNVIGGGKHARDRSIPFQEILVFPLNAPTIFDAVMINTLVHKELSKILSRIDPYFAGGKNDEGAWVTKTTIENALNSIKEAIEIVKSTINIPIEIGIGIDIAASNLWDPDKRVYKYEDKIFRETEHLNYILSLIEKYQILYLEDPFHEDSFEAFAELTERTKGYGTLIVGDDIFATKIDRLIKGIKYKAGNSIIIKPNQVGTISDAIQVIKYARENGYTPVISHRSGETTDETIAHLAVAYQTPLIKTGTVGGERLSKLNELIRIEEMDKSIRVTSLFAK
jgi:enolase